MKMENFSNLSARLAEIEAEHMDGGNAEEAREALVSALRKYRASRFSLGKALAEDKNLFTADRGWMAAAKSIADALDCDERTVRNIISDYARAAKLSCVDFASLGRYSSWYFFAKSSIVAAIGMGRASPLFNLAIVGSRCFHNAPSFVNCDTGKLSWCITPRMR